MRALWALVALGLLVGACSSNKAAPPNSGPAAPNNPGEAGYFFAHQDKLKAAPPDLAGAIRVGLGSFSQPSGQRQPGSPDATFDLSLSYQGTGPDIVILDVIPWRLGDIEKGPGAKLTKPARYGLLLQAGKRATVSVPMTYQRVGGPPSSVGTVSTPAPGGATTPVPTTSLPSSTTLGLGVVGTGVQAAGFVPSQQNPTPVPSVSATIPLPQPSVTPSPRPIPSGTPVGPTLPPSPGGPFDPNAGLQVIIVAAFVGDGVSPDAYKTVQLVPDDQFAATYAKYAKIEQGIAVPLDRLL